MIRGLYVAASSMLSQVVRQEINGANLANLQTTGYKARRAVLGDFHQFMARHLEGGLMRVNQPLLGEVGAGPAVTDIVNDHSQGALRETGRTLDLALEGDGFFQVETPDGILYTRAGDFRLDENGRLVTAAGFPVLAEEGGYLELGSHSPTVTPDGSVFAAGERVGRLAVRRFADPSHLERAMGGMFAPTPLSGAAEADPASRVRQGYLESANVSVVDAAVEMMAAFRAYEAGQQAIQVQDQTLRLAVNELARA